MRALCCFTFCSPDGECGESQFTRPAGLRARAVWRPWPCLKLRSLKENELQMSSMYSPSLEQFRKLAEHGNLIPVTRRLLADIETPLSAYRKIRGKDESFLFESVEGGEHLGRYSFVGCNPRAVIRQNRNTVEILENGKVTESFAVDPGPQANGAKSVRDGLEVVEKVMKKYRAVPVEGLPRFTGGAVGFIGYEFIHDIEPIVPRPPHDE